MLTPDEIARHRKAALALAQQAADLFAPDSPGGRRITRAEARKFGMACLMLGVALLADYID